MVNHASSYQQFLEAFTHFTRLQVKGEVIFHNMFLLNILKKKFLLIWVKCHQSYFIGVVISQL